MGIALGRFEPGRPGSIGRGGFTDTLSTKLSSLIDPDGVSILQRDHPDDLAGRVIAILGSIYGDTDADQIIRTVIGTNGDLRDTLADYLIGPFFKTHVKRYQKRPVYWLLQSPDQTFSVYLFHERATDQTLAVLQGNRYLGARMFQLRQQLREAKQRESASDGRDRARWSQRARELAEELQDLEAFDQAITDTTNEPIVSREGRAAIARWVPELDDGIILNAAPLYRLTPAWKRADPKLDLIKAWNALKDGKYPWAEFDAILAPRDARCLQGQQELPHRTWVGVTIG